MAHGKGRPLRTPDFAKTLYAAAVRRENPWDERMIRTFLNGSDREVST
jgi:hypothetical protein